MTTVDLHAPCSRRTSVVRHPPLTTGRRWATSE